QRRRTEIVCGVHLGSGTNQQIGGLQVIAIACPVQGGRAVSLRNVDVCTFLEQCTQALFVSIFCGIHERRSSGCEQQRCHHKDTKAQSRYSFHMPDSVSI